MIRKCTDEDISDEELKKIINPFYDNYHEYIITYVMPEVIAFYIASSFSRNAMWEAIFYQHYNSAKDIFNVSNDEIMNDTTKYSYDNKEKFIKCFFTVKLKDFNIMQFEQWKREINKLNISLRYKNDIYKFLKSILNFGVKWHNLNF